MGGLGETGTQPSGGGATERECGTERRRRFFFFFLKLLPWRDELSKKQQNGSTRECVQKMIRICMWRTLAHKAAPCKCACVSLSGCDTDPCGGCRVHRSNEQRFLHSEKKKGGEKPDPLFFLTTLHFSPLLYSSPTVTNLL